MAGDLEIKDSRPLEQKGQSQDFETAKRKADKLLKFFAQVEVIDSKTNECVYFQTRNNPPISLLANLLESESDRELPQRIYTTDYTDHDIALLPALLDIRFTPTSKQVQWQKDYLRLLLKNKYLHVSHLGNRSSKESGKQSIQNINLGIKIITELKMNLLLMCECQRIEDYHRQEISRRLCEKGIETKELTKWTYGA